jgi:hypothetical protein
MNFMRLLVPLVLILVTVSARAADPLRMDVQQTFGGSAVDTSVVTVTLENDGPDARGVVEVSGDSGPVVYPVELPQGSRKQLLTFPKVRFGEITFTLATDRGRVRSKLIAGSSEGVAGSIAFVGDESGSLAFVRRLMDRDRSVVIRDAYVKPEAAPGRPSAYSQFRAVILGPGSERMSDETVAALRDYAVFGGTVVFLGGASAPILEDPRWQPLLPGRIWKPVTLRAGTRLPTSKGPATSESFTILSPNQLAAGTVVTRSSGEIVSSTRGLGAGQVVVVGYSPIEPPLSTWSERLSTISAYARGAGTRRAQATIAVYTQDQSSDEMWSGSSRPVPMGYAPTRNGPNEAKDPFSTRLPETNTVFGILVLYFVLVVPVSFILLKRLKRGELAWITAPVLALGFAGALFKSAESLYAASLSTATQGIVFTQEGVPGGMLFANSQIFFPRGGVYDLKLQNIDRLSPVQRNEYEYGMSSYQINNRSLEGFNLVDVGTVIAPRVEASNLAFRELSYSERLPDSDWFRFSVVDRKRIRVQNVSPHQFDGVLASGPYSSDNFALSPGEEKVIKVAEGAPMDPKAIAVADVRSITRQGGRIALDGIIDGLRPGPQIGNAVASRSGITVFAFANARLNEKGELTPAGETP